MFREGPGSRQVACSTCLTQVGAAGGRVPGTSPVREAKSGRTRARTGRRVPGAWRRGARGNPKVHGHTHVVASSWGWQLFGNGVIAQGSQVHEAAAVQGRVRRPCRHLGSGSVVPVTLAEGCISATTLAHGSCTALLYRAWWPGAMLGTVSEAGPALVTSLLSRGWCDPSHFRRGLLVLPAQGTTWPVPVCVAC